MSLYITYLNCTYGGSVNITNKKNSAYDTSPGYDITLYKNYEDFYLLFSSTSAYRAVAYEDIGLMVTYRSVSKKNKSNTGKNYLTYNYINCSLKNKNFNFEYRYPTYLNPVIHISYTV